MQSKRDKAIAIATHHDHHVVEARKLTKEQMLSWTPDERSAFRSFGIESKYSASRKFGVSGGDGNRSLAEPYDRMKDMGLLKISMADHGIHVAPTKKGVKYGKLFRQADELMLNDPTIKKDHWGNSVRI